MLGGSCALNFDWIAHELVEGGIGGATTIWNRLQQAIVQ